MQVVKIDDVKTGIDIMVNNVDVISDDFNGTPIGEHVDTLKTILPILAKGFTNYIDKKSIEVEG